MLVSQLNNFTLAPISEERISEAAGVNSAAGNFGLSFGLAFAGAIMLATLAFFFTSMAEESTVLLPDRAAAGRRGTGGGRPGHEQHPAAGGARRPTRGHPGGDHPHQYRARPRALQVALLVPLVAGVVGLGLSFRSVRLPDIAPSASLEGVLGG